MEPAEAAKIMMGHFDNAEDTSRFYPFERVASMLGLPRDTGIDMLLNIADWDNSNNSRWLAGKEYHAKTLAEVASDKMKHLEFDEFAKRAGCSSSKLAWFIAQP